jgi:DNA-binding NtrC family response regulator
LAISGTSHELSERLGPQRLQRAAPGDDLVEHSVDGCLLLGSLDVPSLRQRQEDIPMLVEYFVKRYSDKARKHISKIAQKTFRLCQSYHWPGNIRELQNIVERSVILSTGDTFRIDPAWLSSQNGPRPESSDPLKQNLQDYEKELIEAALAESNGKVAGPSGAAAKLGIPRSTLDLRIKQLKIKKPTPR